jgi:AmmeMemoRadiSam system protein B
MKDGWFPDDREELEGLLDGFIVGIKMNVNGLIVPHAGYQYSGAIAGKAYGKVKDVDKVVVFGPSHNIAFRGVRSIGKVKTPLGDVKIIENDFDKIDYDHSVVNQIPFLQKLSSDVEVLPLVVGDIDDKDAREIAERFVDFDGLFVFSTDLSHFLEYDEAVDVDMRSVELIKDLDVFDVDACGKYPLMIMAKLCEMRGWKPELVEYQNSGDVTGERDSVVGYASFLF